MKRRQFIQFAMAQTSVGLGAACSADGATSGLPGPGEVAVASRAFPQSVASGDPRPTSIVLWTRVRPPAEGSNVDVYLQLSPTSDFSQLLELDGASALRLTAGEDTDFCIRIRVADLESGTTYYYRFLVAKGDGFVSSRTGRTRTAPASDSDDKVRFAVMSCQDYGGRYFHALREAARQDIHFFVHLGDYVYETTADPEFQVNQGERQVVFTDANGALELEREGNTFFAARSLDNYRELYRTYRSDRELQRLHELHPMIAISDDHEYSNDAWGQTSTYADGAKAEEDPERRANSDRAWFEYMPVDYEDPELEFDPEGEFPNNLRAYRDFRFGQHLHLVMTDLRRYRSDHIISEGAFPGALALTEQQLLSVVDELPPFAVPYVDIDTFADGLYKDFFVDETVDGEAFGFPIDAYSGDVSVVFINERLLQASGQSPMPIDASDSTLQRGISYQSLGKSDMFTSRGARYFLDADAFELVARFRYEQSDGESERAMGESQEKWFIETLRESTRTWKVWGNEFTLMRRIVDLTNPVFPANVRRNMQISAEDWDGMPNRRAHLLDQLRDVTNLTVVTGDIHSFFVGDIGVPGGESIIEFVAGAVSSATFQSLLTGIGSEQIAGLEAFVAIAGPLIQDNNPHLAYQNLASNGFATFEAGPEHLFAKLHMIAFEKLSESKLAGDLEDHFETVKFRVKSETAELELQFEEGYRRWSRERQMFT